MAADNIISTLVSRIADGLSGVNTLVFSDLAVKIRFQIAPGVDAGLGISGAACSVSVPDFIGPPIALATNSDGEISIPLQLFDTFGSVRLTIFGTDYDVTLIDFLESVDSLLGQQQRLEMLGYITGYQLKPISNALRADGIDGPRTQQAIMNFQCDTKAIAILDGEMRPDSIVQLVGTTGV